ncbi:sulfotransferase [Gloeocapsopsis crepidinum LEGE 06123]|uniref:Sulfotransferase n=1 Tax=Gloeocapsopsis crepidinum LEGE 06123 TaxID=588587 RepID=A0ABR9UUQ4_9CHRO|nr:sulfotransferase [Gloeocapsopsis crepidinum]MBE9191780.1 sulfotransferase [Gloeocapsopsis crepidinum LEGE 06123]
MIPSNTPIVIGGTGGSGTRVFTRAVDNAGVDMGKILNGSEDALALTEFCDKWIDIAHNGKDAYLTASEQAAMDAEFLKCIEKHCAHMPAGINWGWKYPRTIYLLPFIYRHFPQMRFIHVVRDGRDMAFSGNQNQLRKHGAAVLGRDIAEMNPQDSFELWLKVNNFAADFGNKFLGKRYIRLQFEELVLQTLPTVRQLWKFLQVPLEREMPDLEIIVPPTIGRWQQADAEIVHSLMLQGEESLRRFGYIDASHSVAQKPRFLNKVLKFLSTVNSRR